MKERIRRILDRLGLWQPLDDVTRPAAEEPRADDEPDEDA